MEKDNLLELKKDIFYRAQIFINEIGEFAPFGSTMIDNIKPVMYYHDTETIDGAEAIDTLKKSFTKELSASKIEAAAIAYDVFIHQTNKEDILEKISAMCIITSMDGRTWQEEYFAYSIIDGKCIWS